MKKKYTEEQENIIILQLRHTYQTLLNLKESLGKVTSYYIDEYIRNTNEELRKYQEKNKVAINIKISKNEGSNI